MPKNPRQKRSGRVGVWLFGAYGGLATTVVVGARALARGLTQPTGLTTETSMARGVGFCPFDKLVFGGHEIRETDFATTAADIHQKTGTLPPELVQPLKRDLAAQSRNVVTGVLPNAGATIEGLVEGRKPRRSSLRAQLERIKQDLTSTEPTLRLGAAHRTIAAFERAIDKDQTKAVRPSAIYAYAAASLGMPF
ncbi:MAG: inositol-3-phosphate synthase, partial [Planctomycetes bacterium]|nr:inositol-3-phosphate synthase [Planctomycetota bacterium]